MKRNDGDLRRIRTVACLLLDRHAGADPGAWKCWRLFECRFNPWFAAEIERVWSIGSPILTKARGKMYTITFEAILFLKVNHRFWTIHDVNRALAMARSCALPPSVCVCVCDMDAGDDLMDMVVSSGDVGGCRASFISYHCWVYS